MYDVNTSSWGFSCLFRSKVKERRKQDHIFYGRRCLMEQWLACSGGVIGSFVVILLSSMFDLLLMDC